MAHGYGSDFETSEDVIMNQYDTMATKYEKTAIVARSIGSCFAPNICTRAKSPQKIQWVLYITPVTSISRIANYATRFILQPFTPYIRGGERGYIGHPENIPHYVVVAENDLVTPVVDIQDLVKNRDVKLQMVKYANHNDIENWEEYLTILKEVF